MRILHFLRGVVFAAGWLCVSICLAGGSESVVDSILAKWEQASQRCRSLDATVTIFRYDDVLGGSEPKVLHGRFYYESPNTGRYEIGEGPKASVNDWPSLSESVIWRDGEVFWIDGGRRTCQRYSVRKLQSLFTPLCKGVPADSWWLSLVAPAFHFQGPKQHMPLLVDVRAAEVRDQFDVTMERRGKATFLKAIPKGFPFNVEYCEINIILNPKTSMTDAVHVVSRYDKRRTTFVFDIHGINERPRDRDSLIDPNLSGLRVIDER